MYKMYGKPVADKLLEEAKWLTRAGILMGKKLKGSMHANQSIGYYDQPKVLIVQVGDRFDSNKYVKNKIRKLEDLGFSYELKKCEESIELKELLAIIDSKQSKFHAVFVQLPLPEHLEPYRQTILDKIDPEKDVDCLTTTNIGRLCLAEKDDISFSKPATAYGILRLLKYYKIELEGARVGIIGRSHLVGKPLIQLLLNENATVTCMHSYTKNIDQSTLKDFDIIITAVGKGHFLQYAPKDSYVIDVGINQDENGQLIGDADIFSITSEYNIKGYTPVPKGVGVTTVAALMHNIALSYFNSMKRGHNNDK